MLRKNSKRNPYHEDIPDQFICPLTLDVMEDPLITREGKNFERQAIVEWLNQGNNTCPLTRQPLSLSKLIPNTTLRMKIVAWKKDNGMQVQYIKPREHYFGDKFICTIFPSKNTSKISNHLVVT